MKSGKELLLGTAWGLVAALLLVFLLYSVSNSAELSDEDGEVEISISADSVTIEVDKEGSRRSVTLSRDDLSRTETGITVDNEVIIENGRIFVDGVELTPEELDRLAVNREEDRSAIEISYGKKTDRIIKRRRLTTAYTDSDDVVRFGDVTVDFDERINGDVVTIGGDATVYGEVSGDVVSVFGDVYLKDDAYVRGDVAAPFGEVFRDEDVRVLGDQLPSSEFKRKKHVSNFGMGARFNRVEGFTLGPSLKYESKYGEYPSVEIDAAYAFTLKRWEYEFKVGHEIGKEWGPYFEGSMYRLAETSDRWLLPTEAENSLAALLFKEDFFDFYWSKGFTGSAGIWYGENLKFGASYTAASIETLERTAKKALFGGDKKFRENWSTILPDSATIMAMEGDLVEYGFAATFDSRDDEIEATSGILGSISYTATTESADFDYEKVDGEFKIYYPLTSDQTLFLRLRGGVSDDDLPLFRRYFIGGIGSLRGYDYKEFEGNRYALFNIDYIWRFYDSHFGAGLFFDGGRAAFSEDEFESGQLKTDIGVSFLLGDFLRVNLAQRLDDIDRSPVLSIRAQILY
jgi:hypothetical protein